jgi:glycosyltransferase involved in cell wall biosynthesis
MRLGILASHPIQYQAPLFRELAHHVDVKVYFAHRQTAQGQADAGFNVSFEWDVDLLGGYDHQFLQNRAKHPSVSRFLGCDTPEIANEIRQGGFDAFLVMGWYLKSFWQAIRACRRHGVPVMVRGDSQLGTPRSRYKQIGKELIYPRLLGQFDACLYVGQRNREYLEHYGVPADRLFFSPHCVDNEAFASRANAFDRATSRARSGIAPAQKAMLFVGKLLDRKRPLDMVQALRILCDRGMNVCGVFAGDGPLLPELEAKGRAWKVPLVFLGFRNQTELPEAYVMADVMVLPSDSSETWGLVVNEALACATPVVVSDAVGCVPDLVIKGQTGAAYHVGDVQELANAIRRVLFEPPDLEALRRISDAYSVSAAAHGVLAAAAWLAEKKPAAWVSV